MISYGQVRTRRCSLRHSSGAISPRTRGNSVYDTETQSCVIQPEIRLDPSGGRLANEIAQYASKPERRCGQAIQGTWILACQVLPHDTFDACCEKVPRVSILSSVQMLIDRLAYVSVCGCGQSYVTLSLISANTQRGGLFRRLQQEVPSSIG
jgi:hypothetical protein